MRPLLYRIRLMPKPYSNRRRMSHCEVCHQTGLVIIEPQFANVLMIHQAVARGIVNLNQEALAPWAAATGCHCGSLVRYCNC
jgi:hypothetical protein